MALIGELFAGLVDSSGTVLANGTVDFYLSETTTRQTVYSDVGLTVPHANPATLDGGGRLIVYSDENLRLVVTDALGNAISTVDNVTGGTVFADKVYLVSPGAKTSFTSPHVDGALAALATSVGSNDAKYKPNRTNAGAARYIKTKLGEIYDVKDSGAAGNGSTNDTSAINATFTDVPTTGGAVYFPAGTYVFTSAITVSKSNLIIYGDGDATILKMQGSSGVTCFDITGVASDITICNLQIQGSGTASSTAAVGIAMASGTSNIKVHNVTFSGTGGSNGLNVGVSCSGTSGDYWIDRCTFKRVFGAIAAGTSGLGVTFGSGALRPHVTNCHFIGNSTMNYGIFLTTVTKGIFSKNVIESCSHAGIWGSGDQCLISDNIVRDTHGGAATDFGNGIALFSHTNTEVRGNQSYGNVANGMLFATSTIGCVINGNACYSNTIDGIQVRGVSLGNNVSGNRCTSNTGRGYSWTTPTAITDPHAATTVSGNLAFLNGTEGFLFKGCSWFGITGNSSIRNSTASLGTYAAYYIQTFLSSAVYYGGRNNLIAGNIASELAATYEHLCAIRFADEDGATSSGASFLPTNRWTGNHFPPQSASGTPAVMIYGSTVYINSTASNGQYGMSTTTSLSMPSLATGVTVFADTTGGNITITLPAISTAGLRFRVMKVAAGNTLTVGTGSAYRVTAGTGTAYTSITATARSASVELLSDQSGTAWDVTSESVTSAAAGGNAVTSVFTYVP